MDVEIIREVETVRKAADSMPKTMRRRVGGGGIFEKARLRADWLFILAVGRSTGYCNECVVLFKGKMVIEADFDK